MKKLNEIANGLANGYSIKKEAKQETLRTLKLALLNWEMIKDSFENDSDNLMDERQDKIAKEIKTAQIIPAFAYGKDKLDFAMNAQKLEYKRILDAVREIEAMEGEDREMARTAFMNKYLKGSGMGPIAYHILLEICQQPSGEQDMAVLDEISNSMAEDNYKKYQIKQQDDMVTRVIANNHLGVPPAGLTK